MKVRFLVINVFYFYEELHGVEMLTYTFYDTVTFLSQ